jgi:WD40 repeat protein
MNKYVRWPLRCLLLCSILGATIHPALAQSREIDYRTLSPWKALRAHDALSSIIFSPDGKTLAGGANGKVLLLDKQGQAVKTLSIEAPSPPDDNPLREPVSQNQWMNSVVFSPDGKWLAAACSNGMACLWDVESGNLTALHDATLVDDIDAAPRTISHKSPVSAVAFSPDSSKLASAGMNKAVKLWDVQTGKLLHSLNEHVLPVSSLTFTQDGQSLLSLGTQATDRSGGEIKRWDTATGELRFGYTIDTDQWHPTNKYMPIAVLGPGGRVIVGTTPGPFLDFWDGQTGEYVRRTEQGPDIGNPLVMVLSHNSRVVATAGRFDTSATTFSLWDVRTGRMIVRKSGGDSKSPATGLAFSPDDRVLAMSFADGSIHIWAVP